MIDPSWAPAACTLPTAQRPLRRAEFDELFAHGVAERLHPRQLRVTLAGGPDLAATVRDLAARETECCSFFTFDVNVVPPGQVRLDIEVPAGQIAVLDALEARAGSLAQR